MPALRDRIVRPYVPFVTNAPYQRIKLPRDGSPKLTRAVLTGKVDIATNADGTIKTTPLGPFGAVSHVSEERSPAAFGPIKEVPSYLFHMLGIPVLRKIPGVTPLDSNSIATHTLLGEMIIPRALGNAYDSFLNARGLDNRDFVVKWPGNGALTDLRDSILTSSTGVWTINATDPLRVEVSEVDAIGADMPAGLVEIGYHYDKFTIDKTGPNVYVPGVRAGERPLLFLILVRDNSVRADLVGGVNNSIKFQYGSGGALIERPAAILQRENQQSYQVGSWYSGLYFLDLLELAGKDPWKIPPVGLSAPPTITLDTASTAPTATADVEILSLCMALTPEGVRKLGG